MVFGGAPTPLPFGPHDHKALIAGANRNHKNNVGLAQDVGHIGGWISAVASWPVRRALGLVRRGEADR